jgi:DNA-binding NarL/FixJ family response regulator
MNPASLDGGTPGATIEAAEAVLSLWRSVRMEVLLVCGERPHVVNGEKRRRVVILDDHPLWLNALAALLEEASIEVVAKVRTADEALASLSKTQADVLVADLHLNGGGSGAACVREALKRHPNVRAAVISAYDDASSVREALASGAGAFVSKAAHPDDVVSAVRQVFEHSIFLAGAPSPNGRSRRQSDRLPGLTPREAEILALVSEGYSNGQVAKALWITEQTVKFHLSNIYRKLGVANRTEASHWALISSGAATPTNR